MSHNVFLAKCGIIEREKKGRGGGEGGGEQGEREKALYTEAVLETVNPISTSTFKAHWKMEYRGWQKRFTSSNRKGNEVEQQSKAISTDWSP